jgi:two-component system heavy metal sensor histidine kinase CusS
MRLHCAGEAYVEANPRLLQRALSNLISNAIKAAPHGAEIRVRCTMRGEYVRIDVQNPGPLIAAHDLPRIFDRFFRADTLHTTRQEGHGLGLAIVQAIARMHDGKAHARSDASGTEIGFTLRRLPPQHALSFGANITHS